MGSLELDLERADLRLHTAIYRWAARQFEPGSVLDVGTELGVGINLMQVENPDLVLIGCDIDLGVLRNSAQFGWSKAQDRVQADAARLPLLSESLSGTCFINVLHLVQDPHELLAETHRVLMNSGKVILFIDVSKLPLSWTEEEIRERTDTLLHAHFQVAAADEFLDEEWGTLAKDNQDASEIYLRVGIKS